MTIGCRLTEEDVIDQLHRNRFADPTGQGLNDPTSHERCKRRALATANQRGQVNDDAPKQDRSPSEFEVHWNRHERANTIDQGRIRNQLRRYHGRDVQIFGENGDINGGSQQSSVAQERVKRADDQDRCLLPFWPLETAWYLDWLCQNRGINHHTYGSLGSSAGTGNSACPYAVSSPSVAARFTVPGISPSLA
jgi:hypothetical protein